MKKSITIAGTLIALANIGEGSHANGLLTRIAEGAVTKGQILKKGTTDKEVAPCGELTDVGLYVALDSAATGELVPCAALGSYTGTVQALATDTIAVGNLVSPTGTAVSSGLTCGRALVAAVSGDLFEIAHKVCT